MKAALVSACGEVDEVLNVGTAEAPTRSANAAASGELLVKVHACSISPSEWRLISGDADIIKKPPGFPYIPSLDVSGTVLESDTPEFAVGAEIVATWDNVGGFGGMAEQCIVKASLTAIRPEQISPVDAAALANSAGHALLAVKSQRIAPADRVLVLGAAGGVGSCIVQLLKVPGVGGSDSTHVTATSATKEGKDLLMSLGVDRVIDYSLEKWWETSDLPFDVIVDCAEGTSAWQHACDGALKPGKDGGRFLALVQKEHRIIMKSYWDFTAFLVPVFFRQLWTTFRTSLPKYQTSMTMGDVTGLVLRDVLDLVVDGKLKAIVDPHCPLPFTTEGVRTAFKLLAERKAHGKLVVQID
ncbi:NADPH-dependent alkenal/one oxidoreductase, chloroplastic [Porphyridium purpureum]|uniref:NADPH-dependent alkenal/one oxidoreductase, chloroplastic n=1 Tax=Porphyridium purpureum TaxID=35688 RepID=A0A5J4Z3E0_PORPP|nr:NADPH-dependent alkenal/one oxidoreductase, chloroplastic [Porphyridium purpureum]|eukprot:POR5180..scf295_1